MAYTDLRGRYQRSTLKRPELQDLFPVPPPELAPNCSEAGVLGILPGIVGTIQATEAIKVILGVGEVLRGKAIDDRFTDNDY